MRLPQFSFYQPTTVDEAGEVLQEKAGARLLSGGTDLLVNMKHRVELPHALVSLRRIAGLRGITRDGGATVIGALTTLKEVQNSTCLLYTSDAADDLLCVDLGGRRIIKKKKKTQ